MKLKTWLHKNPIRRHRLINETGLSVGQISKIVNGKCLIQPKHFNIIEYITEGAVTRKDMRPDIFIKYRSKRML